MGDNIIKSTNNGKKHSFDDIKQIDDEGNEFWSARELHPLLGYDRWENFEKVIVRATDACVNSGQIIEDHFRGATKVIVVGKGAKQKLKDYHITRYACYLIAQNGDPRKVQIASAQTYFAIQTHRQEQFDQLSDEQKRLYIRGQVTNENKKLFETATNWGVESPTDFAVFNNEGYKGLYGMTAKQIAEKKKIGKDKVLDRAGNTELAANLFRITQTQDQLSTAPATGKRNAGKVHNMVGGKVRQAIKEIGGVMPENLPPEKENIKQLEKRAKKASKQLKPGTKSIKSHNRKEK